MNKHQPIRLASVHKKFLYSVFAILWLSGVLWLIFHYFMRVPGEYSIRPHPSEIWWLRLHGLMVFVTLVGLGSVLPNHARRAWQLNKNRGSGLMIKLIFLWLAVTGYAMYYFSNETNQDWLPVLHWAVGISVPLLLLAHIRLGRKRGHVSSSLRHRAL